MKNNRSLITSQMNSGLLDKSRKNLPRSLQCKNDEGFTLVEVAITAIILSVILGSAAAMLINFTRTTQLNETQRKLERIDEALQLFLDLNGKYPCPANPAELIDQGNFGFEVGPDCSTVGVPAGQFREVGRGGRQVRVGMVPVRTLNIPDEYIADAWGNRFTYAVTEVLASPDTYNAADGGIEVVDGSDTNPASANTLMPANPGGAHYVLLSHGPDGAGAIPIGGGNQVRVDCQDAGSLDGLNCNFRSGGGQYPAAGIAFRNTLNAGSAQNVSFFDDIVTFRSNSAFDDEIPPGTVMAFNLAACPNGWIPFTRVLGNTVAGRSIIGAGTYAETEDDSPKNTWAVNEVYNVGTVGGFSEWRVDRAESAVEEQTFYIDEDPTDPSLGFSIEIPIMKTAQPVPQENRPPYVALLYCQRA